MADQAQADAPVTDDQELAKVLASMSDDPTPPAQPQGTLTHGVRTLQPPSAAPTRAPEMPAPQAAEPIAPPPPPPAAPAPTVMPTAPVAASTDLDQIKKMALNELRPIVDKLDLPPEDKFEALLLVIRSSDDQSLIQAAYATAESIADEGRKAQALLDVIKEIEYFSAQNS